MEDSATCGAQPTPAASRKGLNDLPIDVVAQALGLDIFDYQMADVLRAIGALQATPAPLADAELAELVRLHAAMPEGQLWEHDYSSGKARWIGITRGAEKRSSTSILSVFFGSAVMRSEADMRFFVRIAAALPGLLARLAAAEANVKTTTEAIPTLLHYLSLAEQEADKEEPNDGYEALYNAASHVSTRLRGLQHQLTATVKGGKPHA